MTAPAPVIEVRDVTVRYGDVLALDHTDLTVGPARICGLIGTNGSGKSTLFKAVMGLLRPGQGHVRLFGADPASSRRSGEVTYVPQAENVDWDFPVRVRDVVMTGRYGRMGPLRRSRPSDRRAVADALDLVELTHLADRQIGELSGGQRKRAFLARGIAQGARLLLLDEPFAGVDKPSQSMIVRVLRERAAAGGTVLVATHDLVGLPELADEAVLLQNRVLLHGTPDDVLRPENLALAFGGDGGGR